jgi:hypothetical protein
MAERLEMNAQEAAKIMDAWVTTYPNFVDAWRNLDVLRMQLFGNSNAVWYKGPTDDSYFLITDVVRGHQAMLHYISVIGAPGLHDWRKVLEILQGIMKDMGLIKLLWMIPGHARRLYDTVKKCRFEIEGWLKLGCLINSRPTDVAAMALFAEDIDVHLGESDAPLVARTGRRQKNKAKEKRNPQVTAEQE